MNFIGIVHGARTRGNHKTFQMPLVDITNTQLKSYDLPNRQRKTIINICRLRNNLYIKFVVTSSTSTTLSDNESHGHSLVPKHINDPLH